MQRLLEILFGAEHHEVPDGATTSFAWTHPTWMGSYATAINLLLAVLAAVLVVVVYRRDGRRPGARVGLGILRAIIFAYVLVLINRPVLEVQQTKIRPSVVAVLIDDSLSMEFRDTGDAATLTRPLPANQPTTAPSTQPVAGTPATQPALAEKIKFLGGTGPRRIDVAAGLLSGENAKLIRDLASKHALHFYRFSRDASAIGNIPAPDGKGIDPAKVNIDPNLLKQIQDIRAEGEATRIVTSLETVLNNLQNEQLDGIVIITDARETTEADESRLARVREAKVNYFPVLVGDPTPKQNIAVTNLSVNDALKNDIVTARVKVKASGYKPGKQVTVVLKNKKNNLPLKTLEGAVARGTATEEKLPGNRPDVTDREVPMQELTARIDFQATEPGQLDVIAEVEPEPGEYNRDDNSIVQSMKVSDQRINVLYVEGYPRWEYRYLKNEILQQKRETKTVNLACLLTSADPNFRQEADPPEPDFDKRDESGNSAYHDPRTGSKFPGAIQRFPETKEELRKFDVILFGDVDPRQFSTKQIKMIAEYVGDEGAGFGMIAGPQHSPLKYRTTPIDAMLPVTIDKVPQDDPTAVYRDGWLPVIAEAARTGDADTSQIFRLYPDPGVNEEFLKGNWWDKANDPQKRNLIRGGGMQPLFWFCRGVTAKAPVARVLAHHPYMSDPNGAPAPVLVVGKFGAGYTLFNGMEDAWRWRFYNHAGVLDNYWGQQIRYLARGRKIGTRDVKFEVDSVQYEAAEPIVVTLTVYEPDLQKRKSFQAQLVDANNGVVDTISLAQVQEGDRLYRATLYAKYPPGKYRVRLPAQVISKDKGSTEEEVRDFEIVAPQTELTVAHVDEKGIDRKLHPAKVLHAKEAREQLPALITGKPTEVTRQLDSLPLTDTWRALGIFMLLLTTEWVLRKVFGML